MKNIYLNIYEPNSINLRKAKKNLENNNVIGIPTETVYGLAGNAYSSKSVKKYSPPMNILPGDACGPNDPEYMHRMYGNVCPMYRSTDRVQILEIVVENELFE